MRLLLFADVHLDAPFTWAPPVVARARRQALRDALTHIASLANELAVDALCCAGDLFEHERVRADTGAFLRETFGSVGAPVLIAPGNHDWYGPASLYRQVDWSPNVRVFASDRLEPFEVADGFSVWGAAHCAPANTDGFLDRFVVDRGGTNLALFHGSERSGVASQGVEKVPHAPFDAAHVPRAGLAHALVGHFHRPVQGRWHTYPGNPEPLAFGEDGRRGAVLVSVDEDGCAGCEVFEVASGVWQDVRVSLDRPAHAGEAREQIETALAGVSGIVRLTVTGQVGPDADVGSWDLSAWQLQGLGRHLDALVVRPLQVSAGYDIDALAGEPTVRGHFVRDVLAAQLPPDQRDQVLAAGLGALDGRVPELAGS